jgi:hypothetical protein
VQALTYTVVVPQAITSILQGSTDVDVKGVSAVIATGLQNSNGTVESDTAQSDLQVASNGVKASTYTGTIQYILEDAGL